MYLTYTKIKILQIAKAIIAVLTGGNVVNIKKYLPGNTSMLVLKLLENQEMSIQAL